MRRARPAEAQEDDEAHDRADERHAPDPDEPDDLRHGEAQAAQRSACKPRVLHEFEVCVFDHALRHHCSHGIDWACLLLLTASFALIGGVRRLGSACELCTAEGMARLLLGSWHGSAARAASRSVTLMPFNVPIARARPASLVACYHRPPTDDRLMQWASADPHVPMAKATDDRLIQWNDLEWVVREQAAAP